MYTQTQEQKMNFECYNVNILVLLSETMQIVTYIQFYNQLFNPRSFTLDITLLLFDHQ